MAIRTSVHLNNNIEEFLGFFRREHDEPRISVEVSYFLNGYRRFLKHSAQEAMKKLSEDDWTYILNAYNGHLVSDFEHDSAFNVASRVASDLGIENFFDIKDKTVKLSLETISGLSEAESMAVVEMARMFWTQAGNHTGDTLTKTLINLIELL